MDSRQKCANFMSESVAIVLTIPKARMRWCWNLKSLSLRVDGEKQEIISAPVLLREICRLIPFPANKSRWTVPLNKDAYKINSVEQVPLWSPSTIPLLTCCLKINYVGKQNIRNFTGHPTRGCLNPTEKLFALIYLRFLPADNMAGKISHCFLLDTMGQHQYT
jgi:hypothetical protein